MAASSSVYVPIAISEVEEATEAPSKTYCLDLDRGRIIGYVNNLEAVEQAIRKAIITPRFKCLIYDNQYGSEIEDAITTNDASQAYVETVMCSFIEDCLKPDSRVLGVSNFEFDFQGDSVYISFLAETIFGSTVIEEVM